MVLVIALASINSHAEGKKIIKWVDKNGVTQYGDRPPMPNKASKASVLNKHGITVEKIENKNIAVKEDKALANQTRYDNALLASYNSTEEIDLARKRNIKIDELALASLEKKHKNLNLQLQKNNKTLLGFAKKNQPAPADTVKSIEKNIVAIDKVEKQIAGKKQVIKKINMRYDSDKIRYTELASRRSKLHDIRYSNKTIAELRIWRADAQKRLRFYETQNLKHRRAGTKVPKHISDGLVSTTREVESATKEIAANKLAIKKKKAQISQ